MTIAIGEPCPHFVLPSKAGSQVDVGAVIGTQKVILLFMPFAFSSVCTAEVCAIRDDLIARWAGSGVHVFGITVDSPFVTDKFRELEKLPFLVLSDFNKEVTPKFGGLHEELIGLKGVAKRAAFVIDSKGRVAYAWVSENPGSQIDFAALDAAVAAAC